MKPKKEEVLAVKWIVRCGFVDMGVEPTWKITWGLPAWVWRLLLDIVLPFRKQLREDIMLWLRTVSNGSE